MYIIITASPNADGLTAACGKAADDFLTSFRYAIDSYFGSFASRNRR
jgi:hypothetical protein